MTGRRSSPTWPRRVWGVRVEEIHPGLLRWTLGGVEWRWHFWGGAMTRDGHFIANATGHPTRWIAWSLGYEEGRQDERRGREDT